MTLRPKIQAFADAYLADVELNATRAYQTVYPKSSEEAARRSASRLLTRDDVHAYVAERIKERAQRVEVTQDFVVGSLKEVALRCMQKVPVMAWDRDVKAHVQVKNASGEGVWEFDSTGANRSLELLGKHLGIFDGDEDPELPTPVAVTVNVVDGRK